MTTSRYIHTCTIQAQKDKQRLDYDTGTVIFVAGRIVTGATSNAYGTIHKVTGTAASGYLVLTDVSGTFQNNEAITDTGTGSALANGANYDYVSGFSDDKYYWGTDQTGVECRFVYDKPKMRYHEPGGPVVDEALTCQLPDTVTIAPETYRIVSTVSGYTGTFDVVQVRTRPTANGVNQYTAYLEVAS